MIVVSFYNTYDILNKLTSKLLLEVGLKNGGTIKTHCLQSDYKCKNNVAYLE